MTPIHILIVEDDPGLCQMLVALLRRQYAGVQIATCTRITEAHNTLMHESPWDLVIVDGHLPDGDGAQLVECIVKAWGGPPFLGMSGDPQALEALGMAGCETVLPKPFTAEVLFETIDWIFHEDACEGEGEPPTGTEEVKEIIGRCDRILDKIDHRQAQIEGGTL